MVSDEDIADFEVLRDIAMATIFGFLYMGCTLAPPEEYDWTIHVRRRCGLMSNYFDHLLFLVWSLFFFVWFRVADEAGYQYSSAVGHMYVSVVPRIVSYLTSVSPLGWQHHSFQTTGFEDFFVSVWLCSWPLAVHLYGRQAKSIGVPVLRTPVARKPLNWFWWNLLPVHMQA